MGSASGCSRAKAPITAVGTGHVALDIDVFVMDKSASHKEGVSRTYAEVEGYAPIGAHLGGEGWCVGLELREGRAHSAQEADHVLARVLPRAARLTDAPMLVRMDSGFDAGKLFCAIAAASAERQRAGGAPIEALVRWNPRAGGAEALIARALADATLAWHHPREGKRTAVFEYSLERRGGDGAVIRLRRVLALTERTIYRHGQHLLVPAYEVHGFLTTLEPETAEAETVIALYRDHATHEQFHSELKRDLDLERLSSGKFATNDLILSLSALAYNRRERARPAALARVCRPLPGAGLFSALAPALSAP